MLPMLPMALLQPSRTAGPKPPDSGFRRSILVGPHNILHQMDGDAHEIGHVLTRDGAQSVKRCEGGPVLSIVFWAAGCEACVFVFPGVGGNNWARKRRSDKRMPARHVARVQAFGLSMQKLEFGSPCTFLSNTWQCRNLDHVKIPNQSSPANSYSIPRAPVIPSEKVGLRWVRRPQSYLRRYDWSRALGP